MEVCHVLFVLPAIYVLVGSMLLLAQEPLQPLPVIQAAQVTHVRPDFTLSALDRLQLAALVQPIIIALLGRVRLRAPREPLPSAVSLVAQAALAPSGSILIQVFVVLAEVELTVQMVSTLEAALSEPMLVPVAYLAAACVQLARTRIQAQPRGHIRATPAISETTALMAFYRLAALQELSRA